MGKWIASILASIISGVVVYWLTVGSDRYDHRLETFSPSAGASKTDATPAPDVAKTTETLRELQAKSKQVDPAELRQYRERVQTMAREVAELRQITQQYARTDGANLGNETRRKLERVIAQEIHVNGEIDAPEQQPAGSPSAAELNRLKKQLEELEQNYTDLLAIYKSL